MSKGISINIGLDSVLATHYGMEGRLKGCEKDADFLFQLAKSKGFEAVKLLSSTNNANFKDVRDEILKAKANLDDDGLLLVTFSGHGGQVIDSNKNEADGYDETWCLFDEQMIDDELFELWTQFKAGQRIVVISDSCHSGTVTGSFSSHFTDVNKIGLDSKGFNFDNFDRRMFNLKENTSLPFDSITWEKDKLHLAESNIDLTEILEPGFRFIPKDVLDKVTENLTNKERYIQKQRDTKQKLKDKNTKAKDFRELIETSVILISACQDWQLAKDGNDFGLFTGTLKKVLQNGGDALNYIQLHEAVWNELKNSLQNPNYAKIGVPNSKFEIQTCFSI